MTRQLSPEVAVEKLQTAIFDLIDLHIRAGYPFHGATFTHIPIQYRDQGYSEWDVSIQPGGTFVVDTPSAGVDREVSTEATEVPVAPVEHVGDTPEGVAGETTPAGKISGLEG